MRLKCPNKDKTSYLYTKKNPVTTQADRAGTYDWPSPPMVALTRQAHKAELKPASVTLGTQGQGWNGVLSIRIALDFFL